MPRLFAVFVLLLATVVSSVTAADYFADSHRRPQRNEPAFDLRGELSATSSAG